MPSSHLSTDSPQAAWQQGELIELTIDSLNHNGEGVGRWHGRVVFVPDTTPGDRLLVRLVRVKAQYAQGKLHELIEASPHRIRPRCIVADKCGGCQWQQIGYSFQQAAKRLLVVQDLERIGGFEQPPVEALLPVSDDLGYRNKATYPLRRVAGAGATKGKRAAREAHPLAQKPESVQAGYFQKGSHQLINLNQCPIQDQRLNPLLAEVKQDIAQRGWSIYDETKHQGKLRHLGLRIGRRTGEMLLTLVSKEVGLVGLEEQARAWLQRYPELVGVCLNLNPDRTNAIFGGETRCIAGRAYLRETFAGLEYRIQSTTFFQVNTEQAEALLGEIETALHLTGSETLLDAYCGIGTLTLPLSRRVKQAVGIEVYAESIEQAEQNAQLNGIDNVRFYTGTVEALLPTLRMQPDVVLLDPPRKGCDAAVLTALRQMQVDRIVYVSCNSSTLARDLKLLCEGGLYTLTRVQPADFFPQTAHVECAAFLTRHTI